MAEQRCRECGKKVPFFGGQLAGGKWVCSNECMEAFDNKNRPDVAARKAAAKADALEKESKLARISLSTLSNLSGNTDFSVIDVVTAECVFGMNVFKDMFAGIRDVVGGRSDTSERVLKDLKQTCLTELKEEAYKAGADAVIGVGLDYSEFSGGGKSMLFLVASGTAVKILEHEEQ